MFAINAIAPTIINSKLKGLMERTISHPPESESAQASVSDSNYSVPVLKFIVNVSAMEGKFYRYKGDKHPHTNMAKAALNMMTRTSAQVLINSFLQLTMVCILSVFRYICKFAVFPIQFER